jgi:hypothetical protein
MYVSFCVTLCISGDVDTDSYGKAEAVRYEHAFIKVPVRIESVHSCTPGRCVCDRSIKCCSCYAQRQTTLVSYLLQGATASSAASTPSATPAAAVRTVLLLLFSVKSCLHNA